MAISQRNIEIESQDDSRLRCYVAIPDGGTGPGLLLLHDAQSIDDHVKHLANLYAEEGWVVAAAECCAGNAQAIDSETALCHAASALSALRALPSTAGDCGVLGYGAGGRLALLLAARDLNIKCTIAYEPQLRPADADSLANLRSPALVHLATPADAAGGANLAALQRHATIEVRHYAAAPGFDNANLTSYDRSAHWLAKSRTLAVLRRCLGPIHDLAALWEAHLFSEFADRNVDVSMATMVDEPYVFVVPTVTGGTGKRDLHRWYSDHFHFQNPEDTTIIPISRTVGTDRLVDEFIFCFTHDRVMDWILPGVAPTGRYVEVPMTAVVNFRGTKLYHEHIAWDQATVLVQTGLLDPTGLPVTGIEQSKAMQDEALPRNRLIAGW